MEQISRRGTSKFDSCQPGEPAINRPVAGKSGSLMFGPASPAMFSRVHFQFRTTLPVAGVAGRRVDFLSPSKKSPA
jgi:hypothetical protein